MIIESPRKPNEWRQFVQSCMNKIKALVHTTFRPLQRPRLFVANTAESLHLSPIHTICWSFSDGAEAGKRENEEMGMQLKVNCDYPLRQRSNLAGRPFLTRLVPSSCSPSQCPLQLNARHWVERTLGLGWNRPAVGGGVGRRRQRKRRGRSDIVVAAPSWDSWKPDKAPSAPSLSDVAWPAAG